MSALYLMVVGLGAFTAGYLLYSRFISEHIFRLDPEFRTPAHVQEDGVDSVSYTHLTLPTTPYV